MGIFLWMYVEMTGTRRLQFPPSSDEMKNRLFGGFHFMVEMTGIEPVSESIFTGISPSAVSDL